jgi:hypothetical protein
VVVEVKELNNELIWVISNLIKIPDSNPNISISKQQFELNSVKEIKVLKQKQISQTFY